MRVAYHSAVLPERDRLMPDRVGCVSTCRSRYFWFWQAPLGIVELHLSRDDFREVERNFRVPPKGVQNAGARGRGR